jgi:antitoxin component of MazEF toxin-antitoxin module
MQTEIQKWGNSAGIRINKALLDEISASIGDAVDITAVDGGILIRPRKELTLEELLSKSPEGCFAVLPEDEEWLEASPVGKEI